MRLNEGVARGCHEGVTRERLKVTSGVYYRPIGSASASQSILAGRCTLRRTVSGPSGSGTRRNLKHRLRESGRHIRKTRPFAWATKRMIERGRYDNVTNVKRKKQRVEDQNPC